MTQVGNPITAEDAFNATNPDKAAYNLHPDATDEQLQAAREQAAANLLLGSRANAAYWDSRSELEALKARAEGHGELTVDLSSDPSSSTEVDAPPEAETIDGTAEEVALPSGNTPPPTSESSSDVDRLREQLRAAGLNPEV